MPAVYVISDTDLNKLIAEQTRQDSKRKPGYQRKILPKPNQPQSNRAKERPIQISQTVVKERKCCRCKIIKKESDFYGKMYNCKVCAKIYRDWTKLNRKSNIERKRLRDEYFAKRLVLTTTNPTEKFSETNTDSI